MKTKYTYFLIICFLGLWSSEMYSQDKIVVKAGVINNAILINWYSVDPKEWYEGLHYGYTIERESVNGKSDAFARQTIKLKPKQWFEDNAGPDGGLLLPINKMLYDDNGVLLSIDHENQGVLFNYIVLESYQSQFIAEAMGLGFTDSSVVKGEKYRYTIRQNKTGISQTIEIVSNDGMEVQVPKDFEHKFDLKTGTSLSDMYAQSKSFELKAILGKARPKLDSIILRWGPTTPEIWRSAMQDGYEIFKIDSLFNRVKIATIKPWTMEQCKSISPNDSLALLAASFVKDKGLPQKMENENFVEQANMASNYHGFALMIADRSSLAADVLGLRYVDYDVKPGEIYLYEIETKSLKSTFALQTIRVENYFEPLLAPEGFSILKGEGAVTLRWLANSNLTNYGSYIVERAGSNDTSFQILTNPPLVFLNDPSVSQPYYSYTDSISINEVYRYRLRGSNSFGEWSDYAYGLGASIDQTPPVPVNIVSGSFEEDSVRIRLSWKVSDKNNGTAYHQVLLSEDQYFNYSAISGPLPANDTVFYFSVKDLITDRPFYFRVMSADTAGNISESIFRFVSVPDLERPFTPENFRVNMDPKGKITLNWSPSKSKDVTGYHVYYANSDGTDLTLANKSLLQDTSYSWDLDLNTITKNIYVGVKAEDDNYNKSFISEIIKVRRPDTIPPTRPNLNIAYYENNKVYISWKNSSSSDVIQYNIYRKLSNEAMANWKLIDSVDVSINQYSETPIGHDKNYDYAIKAVDDFKNMSTMSNYLQVHVPFPKEKYVVGIEKISFDGNRDINITWNKPNTKNWGNDFSFKYQLFRSIGNDELLLYKEFEENETYFSEKAALKNVLYNYSLRIKIDTDKYGALSEVKSILIK